MKDFLLRLLVCVCFALVGHELGVNPASPLSQSRCQKKDGCTCCPACPCHGQADGECSGCDGCPSYGDVESRRRPRRPRRPCPKDSCPKDAPK